MTNSFPTRRASDRPGGIVSEVDFFHYPSRTLVLTDLIENIEPRRVKNILYRWLIRLGGAADPDSKAPRDMQWSFRKHRAEVPPAAARLIGWSPEGSEERRVGKGCDST